jgi:hypothetical protein
VRRISPICIRLAPITVPRSVPVTPAAAVAQVSGGSRSGPAFDLGPAQRDIPDGTIP